MLPSFCKSQIMVSRAPYIEERGSRIRDWNNASTFVIAGCSVQPADTSGDNKDREQTEISATLYAGPYADIEQGDRIIYNGVIYDIIGEPYLWESPTGKLNYIGAKLKEWNG